MSKPRVTVEKISLRVVGDTAKHFDSTAPLNEVIANIIKAKGLWPKMLADNQYLLLAHSYYLVSIFSPSKCVNDFGIALDCFNYFD